MIDCGAFSTSNRDLDTGIRYGIIALNSLNLSIDEELFNLPNPSEDEALAEFAREVLKEKIGEGKLDFNDFGLEEECDLYALLDALHEMSDEEAVELLDSAFQSERDHFWDGLDADLVGAEGEIEGVKVRVTEVGGAYHLWVFESPHTGYYAPCSPVCPGAGDLDSPIGEDEEPEFNGVLTYDVPPSWREID